MWRSSVHATFSDHVGQRHQHFVDRVAPVVGMTRSGCDGRRACSAASRRPSSSTRTDGAAAWCRAPRPSRARRASRAAAPHRDRGRWRHRHRRRTSARLASRARSKRQGLIEIACTSTPLAAQQGDRVVGRAGVRDHAVVGFGGAVGPALCELGLVERDGVDGDLHGVKCRHSAAFCRLAGRAARAHFWLRQGKSFERAPSCLALS